MPDDIHNLPDEDYLNRKVKHHGEELERLEADERNLRAKLDPVRDVEAELIGKTAIEHFGPWSDITNTQIKERIEEEHDRVAALVAIFESLAIHSVLATKGDWMTADEIATATDLTFDATMVCISSSLAANAVNPDDAWLEERAGQFRVTEKFASTESIIKEFDGTSVMTVAGRVEAAKRYCKSLGIAEVDMIRVSPALALVDNFVKALDRKHHEEGMLRIVNLKRPTWAGARCFNEAYADCVERARLVKNSHKPFEEFDGLTQIYCYTGASMYDAHVLTMTSAQVLALPKLMGEEKAQFIKDLRFPFEPNFFIDFSADGKLPAFESGIAKDKMVSIGGALYNRWDDNILITPILIYDSLSQMAESTVPLGMVVYNQQDDREFHWAGLTLPMEKTEWGTRGTVIIAHTDVLDQPEYSELSDEYRKVIQYAADSTLDALFMLEAANVETVEKTLERRDAKRAEKRGWYIPSTVRVIRNRRRKNGSSQPTGEGREYGHQFPVRGFYRHVTKGTHVRCPVCFGQPIDTGCSHCSNTGLDPKKVKPCARIDVTTGKQTCPNGCRREWTPDHIRGPEDAPLLIKTHDIKDAA